MRSCEIEAVRFSWIQVFYDFSATKSEGPTKTKSIKRIQKIFEGRKNDPIPGNPIFKKRKIFYEIRRGLAFVKFRSHRSIGFHHEKNEILDSG